MTNPRIHRLQDLRRSNAAQPRPGRKAADDWTLEDRAAARESQTRREDENMAYEVADARAARLEDQELTKALQDVQEAASGHQPTYEADYGVRYVCTCRKVSGYYISRAAAAEAWEAHALGEDWDTRPGTHTDH